jgi:hypothetical protein
MTQFLTALSTTVIIYAFVTRGALVFARFLSLVTGKSKSDSSKRPPSGGHPAKASAS